MTARSETTGPRLAAAAAVLLVMVSTLSPTGATLNGFARCVFCNPRALADFIANVAMFAPLGAALGANGLGPLRAAVVGAFASTAVEVLQQAVPGRDPSLSDIIANTVGALAGIGLRAVAGLLWRPSRAVCGRLALGAGVAACAMWSATGYFVAPAFPATQFWGQWTPRLESLDHYDGHVVAASIGGLPIGPHAIGESERLRERLGVLAPVAVEFSVGHAPASVAPIFSLTDAEARRVMFVGAVGDDVIYRYRSRAVDWRLNQPDTRASQALAPYTPGDIVQLRITRESSGSCVLLADQRFCGLGYGIGDGWSLIVTSSPVSVRARQTLQVVWSALAVMPVGLWLRGGVLSGLAAAMVAAGAIVVPAMTILMPVRGTELMGLTLGFGIGAAIGTPWRK